MAEPNFWAEPVAAQLGDRVHLTENFLFIRGKRMRRNLVSVTTESGFSVCKKTETTGANYTFARYPIFLIFGILHLILVVDFYREYIGRYNEAGSTGIVFLGISALFFLLYVFIKGFILEFQFPGGSICCSISGENKEEVEKFIAHVMKK